jgi:uncharacterized protein YndB with AHSA1/START domain
MTRKQEHEITIDAPIDAVWKAITDAEELTRWFVEEASVEPGVGGTFTISWGGEEKGQSRIEAWQPNELLRVALVGLMENAKHDGSTPIVDEYTLERRDGKTVLRLVSSNIPSSPDWDGFYDGTNSGWKSFLRTLRHYLEHHRGKPRATIKIVGRLPGSLEEAWAHLTGPGGLGFQPVAGQAFSAKTGAGEPLSGRVVHVNAPSMLELDIREPDDVFLAHSMAGAGGNQYVYTVLSVYGKSQAEVAAIRAKWQPWLETVLGVESPGHAGL